MVAKVFYLVSKVVFLGFKSIEGRGMRSKCLMDPNVTNRFCNGSYTLYFNEAKLVLIVIVVVL